MSNLLTEDERRVVINSLCPEIQEIIFNGVIDELTAKESVLRSCLQELAENNNLDPEELFESIAIDVKVTYSNWNPT